MPTIKKEQVIKLKITAVNIRSVLTENNKKLSKLNSKKSSLVRRQALQAERMTAEKNIEKKQSKGGPIKSVLSNVTGVVMSMKDRILNFFGYLMMGFLVDKLPSIIKGLKSAFDTVSPLLKVVWDVTSTIAKSLFKFGGWIMGFFNKKESEKNIEALSEGSALVEKEVDTLASNVPGLESDNSQKSTETEKAKISKSTPDNADQQLKTSESNEEKAEIATAEKEQQEEEEESPVESLLAIDPSKLLGGDSKKSQNILGGSDQDAISSDIESSTKGIISKVEKYSRDLKGNIEDANVKTVIIPIEVEKIASNGQSNNSGGSLSHVDPLSSSLNNSDMRMP